MLTRCHGPPCLPLSEPQSTRQTWNAIQHDGPTRLELRLQHKVGHHADRIQNLYFTLVWKIRTMLQHCGPNHLGLRCNALHGQQMALITSGCGQGVRQQGGRAHPAALARLQREHRQQSALGPGFLCCCSCVVRPLTCPMCAQYDSGDPSSDSEIGVMIKHMAHMPLFRADSVLPAHSQPRSVADTGRPLAPSHASGWQGAVTRTHGMLTGSCRLLCRLVCPALRRRTTIRRSLTSHSSSSSTRMRTVRCHTGRRTIRGG